MISIKKSFLNYIKYFIVNWYTNADTITIQADSVVSDTNGLLTSDYGPWWGEERDTILKNLC